jgi:membrane protease YdiL (CAAX protease family)
MVLKGDKVMSVSGRKYHQGAEDGFPPASREQLLELSIFLLLIVPSMVLSFFAVRQGGLSFPLTAWATILRDLGLVALIFYFLRRNGEPVASIGWTARKSWREIGLGLALFFPFTLGAGLLERGLLAAGFSVPSTPLPASLTAKGIPELLLAAFLVLVVAVSEEIIFRGYLILRLRGVTASNFGSVLLSGGHRRLHGSFLRGRLPVAGQPGGPRGHPFFAGFHRDCVGASPGSEIGGRFRKE